MSQASGNQPLNTMDQKLTRSLASSSDQELTTPTVKLWPAPIPPLRLTLKQENVENELTDGEEVSADERCVNWQLSIDHDEWLEDSSSGTMSEGSQHGDPLLVQSKQFGTEEQMLDTECLTSQDLFLRRQSDVVISKPPTATPQLTRQISEGVSAAVPTYSSHPYERFLSRHSAESLCSLDGYFSQIQSQLEFPDVCLENKFLPATTASSHPTSSQLPPKFRLVATGYVLYKLYHH